MASSSIQFFVPGVPKSGGSKKAFRHATTGKIIVTEQVENKDWRASVAHEARAVHRGRLLDGPLTLEIIFLFNRPKSHYGSGKNAKVLKPSAPRWHTQKPDATKLLRSTEDALTKVLWMDDSQICEQKVTKLWLHREFAAGAHIFIRKLDGETK